MRYTITPSEEGPYIEVKYFGGITREEAIKATVESHAVGKKHGINRYLVDATEATNVESVFSNYSFAYEDLVKADIDRFARVALLVRPDDTSHDFVETSSINAGYNVTLFRSRDRAVKHLMDSSL